MRIGFNLINSNTAPRGCDRYAIELVHALSRQCPDDSLVVFCAPWQAYLAGLDGGNVTRVVLDAPRGRVARALWQKFRFVDLARQHQVELLHYTNPIPLGRGPIPLLVTIHDVAEFSAPRKYGWLRSIAKRRAVREAINRATHVIVVSETTRQEVLKFTAADDARISVTPEGVSVFRGESAGGGDPLRGYGLPRRFQLYVGVTERTKQVELMVRAFAEIDERVRDGVGLVIAGRPGNGQRDVDAAIRSHHLDTRVRQLGHVPDEVLWSLYARAEAFIFPSLVEGFGLPVLEAMAAGLPVVATDIPIMREVAGDAALLVPPNDVAALSNAMTRLCKDAALRARLAQDGLQRSRLFNWAETARLTRAAYGAAVGALA